MHSFTAKRSLIGFILWAWFGIATGNNLPQVIVSIAPFYGLTHAIMEGVGTPELLIPASVSPHHFTLKPSQLSKIEAADLIIWGGPELETSLKKPLHRRISKSQVLELVKVKNLKLLSARQPIHGTYHDHFHGVYDMHFWLDPMNAKLIARAITTYLIQIDASHQKQYSHNLTLLLKQLEVLDHHLQKITKPLKKAPYLVFHDAYQYFEHRYDLNFQGAIHLNPERPLSIVRTQALQAEIKDKHIQCIFAEPQFSSESVKRLAKSNGVGFGILDPLGSGKRLKNSNYSVMMEDLAQSFAKCLEASKPHCLP